MKVNQKGAVSVYKDSRCWNALTEAIDAKDREITQDDGGQYAEKVVSFYSDPDAGALSTQARHRLVDQCRKHQYSIIIVPPEFVKVI